MRLDPRRVAPKSNCEAIAPGYHHPDPAIPLVMAAGLPSISRLRREPRYDDIDPASTILEVAEKGGALRTLAGGAHRHLIGVYPSKKTGWPNPWEGRVERALIHWSEANPNCDDYQSQSGRLLFSTPDGLQEWLIDMFWQGIDGGIEAIEVKRTPRDLRDPAYALKLAYAAAIIRSFGWRFRIMYAKDIFGPPARRTNVQRVQARRTLNIDDELPKFERLLSMTNAMSFGQLRNELHPNRIRSTAVIHRLIASRRVALNLDQPMTGSTPVELRAVRQIQSRIRF